MIRESMKSLGDRVSISHDEVKYMKLIKKLNTAINRKQKARKALIKQTIVENEVLLKLKATYLDLQDL
ncbi:MAG: hypothetical protein EOM67_16470 [Spirochaetia bacterium]|nr:hypothetical protein [Spirochaetia bacterium]